MSLKYKFFSGGAFPIFNTAMLSQRGGKGKGNKLDVTKKFIFNLLEETVYKKGQNNSSCIKKLKPFIDNDFEYRGIKNNEGIKKICQDLGSLDSAFSNIQISVTHFKDYVKHSYIVVIMVIGNMVGPWLTRSATNNLERVGIVLNIETNKKNNKIQNITFNHEYLSNECYQKIKALDLLHTSFKIQEQEANKPINQKENLKNIELVSVAVDENIQEPDFEELLINAENNANNNNNTLFQNNNDNNGVVGFAIFSEGGPQNSSLGNGSIGVGHQNFEDALAEIQGARTSNLVQEGGDGYYPAVGQTPIAGRPVYQRYSSCCKPYFSTDGSEYEQLCQIGVQKGGQTSKYIPLKSHTLVTIKDGVIYSITASVLDSIGESTANVMNLNGKEKDKIKEYMIEHLHYDTHKNVKDAIDQGINTLFPNIKTNETITVNDNNNNNQEGGNFIGTLGTIIFPSGSAVTNIVPWLLTLGSMLSKKIEKDVYKTSTTTKKKRVVKKKKSTSAKRKKSTSVKKKKVTKKKTSTKKKSTSVKKKKTSKKWKPLTNAEIKRLIKNKKGGFCGNGICGDAALSPFNGCKRPDWGWMPAPEHPGGWMPAPEHPGGRPTSCPSGPGPCI